MPGSPVSIADYLAIEIACRHTNIQRSLIADYFDITVNALNARLRTCSDRLQQFPDFVAYGITLLEVALRSRHEFSGKVHPIWEISKRLLQSYTNGTLKDELEGFKDNKGTLFNYLTTADFTVNGTMPQERPNDDLLHLPTTRKRKHGADSKDISQPASPQNGLAADLLELKKISSANNERTAQMKKQRVVTIPDLQNIETSKTEDQQAVEKATGKGSRSEPYSQHELCSIYIARKIRMLDWDTISWALSRFKTPTVAILSDARAVFDQYHELIVDTLRLCCWPQDSMYLISCAAGECLAALERGNWSDELKSFRNSRGNLYQIYMQRRLERIYKKSFETPAEKKYRRRRERIFGYEGLSIEDFENLPAKKKLGSEQSKVKDLNKVRKRRTKEEMRQVAEEKAAAKALLKANGLKANGEAMADRRKQIEKSKREPLLSHMPPTFGDTEAATKIDKGPEKQKKGPRRKYDIPELERIAFASGPSKDRRMSYDVDPDDLILTRQLNHNAVLDNNVLSKKETKLSNVGSREVSRTHCQEVISMQNGEHETEPRGTDKVLGIPMSEIVSKARPDSHTAEALKHQKRQRSVSKQKLLSQALGGNEEQQYEARGQNRPTGNHNSRDEITSTRSKETRSPNQSMSISSVLDAAHFRNSNTRITESFESAAASPFIHKTQLRDRQDVDTKQKPQEQKPRSSMSLAALLN